MSQDLQLSSMSSLPMQADYVPSGGGGGSGQGGGNPLSKLHRLLRGRYPIVVILALLFGAVGGLAGWVIPKPSYVTNGAISLDPTVASLDEAQRVQPMFVAYVAVQEQVIQSPRILQAALNSKEWKATGRSSGPDAMAAFLINLVIDSPKNTNLITIAYTDSNQAVAGIGTQALIAAYINDLNDKDVDDITSKIKTYEDRKNTAIGRINILQSEITALGLKYGSNDLSAVHNQQLAQLAQMETQLNAARGQLESVLANGDKPTTRPVNRMTEEQFAAQNTFARDLLHQKQIDQLDLDTLRGHYGVDSQHPSILAAQQKIAVIDKEIQDQIDAFYKSPNYHTTMVAPDGTLYTQTVDPQVMKAQVDKLQSDYEQAKQKANDLGKTWVDMQAKQQEITQRQAIINDANKELDGLNYRQSMIGRVHIVNDGSQAVAAPSKRPLIAAAGFIGGMGLPVGLMMLIGLMDSRLRYSDETDSDMSGITLLGILPNLPDRLSDPEQAATAAHCVHQIRTMLQINGAATDQSVFAVTSASPGDGKTSLTLALGLSFAACGSRTLLIDCDLAGAGLTRRLGITAENGILEAAANRAVLEYIRTTDITDVALLPVGTNGTMHASTLSPNTLRRIIIEAKKHFDTIVIDTGPILGSIEASLVATVADGIVLTVARGQQRQLVEKSIRHLMSIGAKVAGVVFNRAQAKDFERSLSMTSQRSVGFTGAPLEGTARYGVLGRAVHTSAKPDEKAKAKK